MSPALFLAVLSLVQSGWKVEETPLAPEPWQVDSARPVDDELVAVVAHLASSNAKPSEFAIFLARSGAAPALLQRFSSQPEDCSHTGTGVTFRIEEELFRVRLGEQPSLVSLGKVPSRPNGVTCDDAITDCVITFAQGAPLRWHQSALTRLYELPSDSDLGLDAWGAAMSPDGGVVALGISQGAAVLTLDSGKVTFLRGALTLARPSFAALHAELESNDSFREKWDAAAERCATTPVGWAGGKPRFTQQDAEEGIDARPCNLEPLRFELASGKRKALAEEPYPWSVIDCPQGGWTSAIGTMVTDCTSAEERDRAMIRPRIGSAPRFRELPEAIALSPTELFVMEPEEKHPYRWYRGKPKGKGLTFLVDGPSVLSFKPKGVVVEQVTDWRYGAAIFAHPLADDWHLVFAPDDSPKLLRLRQQ